VKAGLTVAAIVLAGAHLTLAKDASNYSKGLLLSMDSSSCGTTEKSAKTAKGQILGTDSEHGSTHDVLCQEYVLQADRITYHIRPTDTKHRNLLPVGETINYRIHKDKMYVQDREDSSKEREYSIVSIQMRSQGADLNTKQ
jgi:hypothetical protein